MSNDNCHELELEQILDTGLSETKLCLRTINLLDGASIYTVQELLDTSRKDLRKIRHFGCKSLQECFDVLVQLGFEFKSYAPEEVEKVPFVFEHQPEISIEDKMKLMSRCLPGTSESHSELSVEDKMAIMLKYVGVDDASCSLLACGGILTVKDLIDSCDQTLKFLLSADGNRELLTNRLRRIERLIERFGFTIRKYGEN